MIFNMDLKQRIEYGRRYYARNRDRMLAQANARAAEIRAKVTAGEAAAREAAKEAAAAEKRVTTADRRVERHRAAEKRKIERRIAMRPQWRMLKTCRSRARERGLPFDLMESDIVIPEFCPILGMRMERSVGSPGAADNSPSLDRIVPALGYVVGNVRVISQRANFLKMNATPAETSLMLRDAASRHAVFAAAGPFCALPGVW